MPCHSFAIERLGRFHIHTSIPALWKRAYRITPDYWSSSQVCHPSLRLTSTNSHKSSALGIQQLSSRRTLPRVTDNIRVHSGVDIGLFTPLGSSISTSDSELCQEVHFRSTPLFYPHGSGGHWYQLSRFLPDDWRGLPCQTLETELVRSSMTKSSTRDYHATTIR